MTETPIERVQLTLRLDATITIYDQSGNPTNWLKPGSEAAVSWKGLPSDQEVSLAYQYLNARNHDALKAVIEETNRQLRENDVANIAKKKG